MIEFELTPEQRAKAGHIIQEAVMWQYTGFDADNHGGFMQDAWTDVHIFLSIPGGIIKIPITDEQLIEVIKTIDEVAMEKHGEIGELLEGIDDIEPEDES